MCSTWDTFWYLDVASFCDFVMGTDASFSSSASGADADADFFAAGAFFCFFAEGGVFDRSESS
jgi:hypothetical protein